MLSLAKIAFFDIDGTLLDDDKNLPTSTKDAIYQLKQNGVYVALATGRAPFMLEQIRKELEVDSFVSFNGQYVVFENEVVYKNPLPNEHLRILHEDATNNGHPLVFLNEETMKSTTKNHDFIEKSLHSLKFPYPEVDRYFYEQNEIFQTLVFCTDKEERQYIGRYEQFHFIRWHRYSLDVLPYGGSKAIGIKQLIDQLGFQMKDVYAFGDGLNDIEMIQAVGTGVAMGNGVPEIKKHADFIARKVTEDGIWHSLKELKLI